MKKIFGAFLVLFFANIANAQEAMLCHIASAGFYATDGKKGTLLDALYAGGLDGYEQASDDLNRKLEYAQGIFSNVRLLFASHFHGDHMTGEAILKHLRANRQATALVTEQAMSVIEAAGIQDDDNRQIRSFYIPIGENNRVENLPFPVTLYGISHGEEWPLENIGIAVTVAGKTIMHVGDMSAKEEDLQKAEVTTVEPDYLLMPYWYLMSPESAAEINRIFKPKKIIPIHFPPPNGAGISGPDEQRKLLERVNNISVNVIKLDEEMQCLSLD
jgi:L-ascorbate metabolism protein UlaG (beta-lactamase superfamily)